MRFTYQGQKRIGSSGADLTPASIHGKVESYSNRDEDIMQRQRSFFDEYRYEMVIVLILIIATIAMYL